MTPGRVLLIGAGPGDPDLLTVRAVRALARCDVVLVDDLVPRAVLSCCRPDVRVIPVGKRPGRRGTTQERIHALLITLARGGAVVGRVKNGDPCVFGRGAEEAAALRAAGIQVEVVPGLTAGLAVPAAAGISVTTRTVAHGVVLVTGQTADGSDVDWAALARTRLTLVVYMGLARVRAIASALVAGGLPAATPAMAIASGTRPDERRVVTTLGRLAEAVERARLRSPSLLVVGDVVAAARALPGALACRAA